MSPEYEGPEDGEHDAVAPRRVRHLIVLPGGGDPDDGAGPEEAGRVAPASLSDGSEWDWEPDNDDLEAIVEDGESPQPAQTWSSGMGTGSGAAVAAAQVAETVPLEAPPAHSLRLKLKVISQTVTSTKAPGMPFIILASVLVSAAIFGLVLLRVMVDQASFRVDSLDSQVTKQEAQLRQLRFAVSVQEAPGQIASLASQAGLVPGTQMQTLLGAGQATSTATTALPAAQTSQSPRSQVPSIPSTGTLAPQALTASPPAPPAAVPPASGGAGSAAKGKTSGTGARKTTKAATGTAPR